MLSTLSSFSLPFSCDLHKYILYLHHYHSRPTMRRRHIVQERSWTGNKSTENRTDSSDRQGPSETASTNLGIRRFEMPLIPTLPPSTLPSFCTKSPERSSAFSCALANHFLCDCHPTFQGKELTLIILICTTAGILRFFDVLASEVQFASTRSKPHVVV